MPYKCLKVKCGEYTFESHRMEKSRLLQKTRTFNFDCSIGDQDGKLGVSF